MFDGAIFIAKGLAKPVKNILGSCTLKNNTPSGYKLQKLLTKAVLPVPIGPTINPNMQLHLLIFSRVEFWEK